MKCVTVDTCPDPLSVPELPAVAESFESNLIDSLVSGSAISSMIFISFEAVAADF